MHALRFVKHQFFALLGFYHHFFCFSCVRGVISCRYFFGIGVIRNFLFIFPRHGGVEVDRGLAGGNPPDVDFTDSPRNCSIFKSKQIHSLLHYLNGFAVYLSGFVVRKLGGAGVFNDFDFFELFAVDFFELKHHFITCGKAKLQFLFLHRPKFDGLVGDVDGGKLSVGGSC